MSSTFIEISPSTFDNTGVFRNTAPIPVWLQFIPGHVTSIETSDGVNIGTIRAVPHVGNQGLSGIKTHVSKQGKRYKPLFRGINEIPAKGDQVLLCTFGEREYYIGPLNSENNPNFNRDFFYNNPEASTLAEQVGLSENFPLDVMRSKLGKLPNSILDGSSKPTHGDIMLEGRHGNSIRIGSRSNNPYIVFSNGRGQTSRGESVIDGTLMAIINRGSMKEHFGPYQANESENKIFGYLLGSDDLQESNRTMAQLVGKSLGDENITDTIYNYNRDQLFQSSDRIVFNAKKNHIFMSARQNVNIGAGKDLTLSSNNKILFGATNIYLGEQEDSQGLVLGENLRELLVELITVLENANGWIHGVPSLLGHNMGALGSLKVKLAGLKQKLNKDSNDLLSKKHFVEKNT